MFENHDYLSSSSCSFLRGTLGDCCRLLQDNEFRAILLTRSDVLPLNLTSLGLARTIHKHPMPFLYYRFRKSTFLNKVFSTMPHHILGSQDYIIGSRAANKKKFVKKDRRASRPPQPCGRIQCPKQAPCMSCYPNSTSSGCTSSSSQWTTRSHPSSSASFSSPPAACLPQRPQNHQQVIASFTSQPFHWNGHLPSSVCLPDGSGNVQCFPVEYNNIPKRG